MANKIIPFILSIALLVIAVKSRSNADACADVARVELENLKRLRDEVAKRQPMTVKDSLWLIRADDIIHREGWRLK